MSLHQVKTIFFDAAGTLFTVNGSVGDIYARIARDYGKEVAVSDLELGFRRCFAAAPPMAFPGAAPEQIPTLEKQWWRTLVREAFAPLGPFPAFDAYFDALFNFFARAEAWRLYPETLSTLDTLQAQGFTLGVISNFDSRLFDILDGFDIARFFDPIIISTRAGAAKPEQGIFIHALTRAGVKAREALHVGDSYEADIVGARMAGLTPVFINRGQKIQENVDSMQVSSLANLVAIVDECR
jgi:putative hydrolase of the HAD superfamily